MRRSLLSVFALTTLSLIGCSVEATDPSPTHPGWNDDFRPGRPHDGRLNHGGGGPGPVNAGPSQCMQSATSDTALLYANDFEDAKEDGSMYPQHAGHGTLCDDANVEAAFPNVYGPRAVTFADGKRGIRFPTMEETPNGYDYSMQSPYVTFRGKFLDEQCLAIKFTVRMPERYDISAPQYYGDLRGLFRYYVEGANGHELFSARFVSNTEIGFYENNERIGASIKLQEKPAAGAAHEVVVKGCFVPNGTIEMSFDGVRGDTVTLNPSFQRGNVFFVTSPGNGILHDTDLSLFSAIDSVEVRRAGAPTNEQLR